MKIVTVHTLGRAIRPGMFYRQSDRPLQVRTTRPLPKELDQVTRKAQRRAQIEEYAPNPKAAQAYREKGGSLEDKMTSLEDKDKYKIR